MTQKTVNFSRSAQDLREFLDYEIAKRSITHSPLEWYTQPIHKTVPTKREISYEEKLANTTPSPRRRVYGLTREDEFAAEYFPATFSAPYRLEMTPKPTLADTPEPQGLPGPAEPWRPFSPKRTKRPHTSMTHNQVDKMFAMADEMPVTAVSTVALSTPYQLDLANLRLERLRIEESHLLEVKRLEELERIRGPKTKWYEMKTPDFHYEAHKNTQLVRRRNDYQALYDYRMRLIRASREFELQKALSS